MSLVRCDWADNSRIACSVYFSQEEGGARLGYERLIALDIDGKNMISLSQPVGSDALRNSREMDSRLRAAGKQSQLVIYRNLDHQLDDGDVRADLLRKADVFLRQSMHIAG